MGHMTEEKNFCKSTEIMSDAFRTNKGSLHIGLPMNTLTKYRVRVKNPLKSQIFTGRGKHAHIRKKINIDKYIAL